jgi:hypothetical protein
MLTGRIAKVFLMPPQVCLKPPSFVVARLNNDGVEKFTCSLDEHHELFRKGRLTPTQINPISLLM